MATYARLPVAFRRGEGAWLWDTEGRRYLDAVAGIAVCGLGHAHPAVTQAVCEQAGTLIHTSNLYGVPLQAELAERLCRQAGMDAAFFCNSGAEANEAAIKLARLHGHRRGRGSPRIVVTDRAFHGRTLATLTATGNPRIQAGFDPLVEGFVRVPYDDLAALERVAGTEPEVAAVLLESIQGEAGVIVPDPNYLAGVRAVCDREGWLMMVDEVQTGMGRTGRWFGHQHAGCLPDVTTLAKSLGNGVPVGACLARGDAASLFGPGSHATTFGGNPLACRAALAVVETLEREDLITRAGDVGERMLADLRARLAGRAGVSEIRGRGLMIGVALERPCQVLAERALEHGLLINVTGERVVRLLPPLVIGDDEAEQIVETVAALVSGFLEGEIA